MDGKRNDLPQGMNVISLRIPAELHEELKAAAVASERTLSQEARYAISLHLKRRAETVAA